MGIISGQRPIKLGVSAGQMATLKKDLPGKDGADYPAVCALSLSLGRECSGKHADEWKKEWQFYM